MILTNKSTGPRLGLAGVILWVIFLSGCSVRYGDFTLVSTKNIDLSDTTLDARTGKREKGEDCRIALLGIIPLGLPNLKDAVDEALEKGGGNVMVDQVTHVRTIYFILASQMCYLVEGTVLNIPQGPKRRL